MNTNWVEELRIYATPSYDRHICTDERGRSFEYVEEIWIVQEPVRSLMKRDWLDDPVRHITICLEVLRQEELWLAVTVGMWAVVQIIDSRRKSVAVSKYEKLLEILDPELVRVAQLFTDPIQSLFMVANMASERGLVVLGWHMKLCLQAVVNEMAGRTLKLAGVLREGEAVESKK